MLNTLIETKEDIKISLQEKQAEITGGLNTYADAIRNIPEYVAMKIKISNGVKLSDSTFEEVPPEIEFVNVTDMSYMFSHCPNLYYVPDLKTSNVTNMSYMFYSSINLRAMARQDAVNVKDVAYMFGWNRNLSSFSGLENLGAQSNLKGTGLFINELEGLSYYSITNIIKNLYDRKKAGYSVLTIKLHADVLAKLSVEDIAVATNKGWIIS